MAKLTKMNEVELGFLTKKYADELVEFDYADVYVGKITDDYAEEFDFVYILCGYELEDTHEYIAFGERKTISREDCGDGDFAIALK